MPKSASQTKLAVPVKEFEIGTSLNISLEHKHGGSAYSSVTSYVLLKGVVSKPIETEEALNNYIHVLGKIADDLVKERVVETSRTVHLKPVFEKKADSSLEEDELLSALNDMKEPE